VENRYSPYLVGAGTTCQLLINFRGGSRERAKAMGPSDLARGAPGAGRGLLNETGAPWGAPVRTAATG